MTCKAAAKLEKLRLVIFFKYFVIDGTSTYNDNLSVEDTISADKVCIGSDTDEECIDNSSITEDQMKKNDKKQRISSSRRIVRN